MGSERGQTCMAYVSPLFVQSQPQLSESASSARLARESCIWLDLVKYEKQARGATGSISLTVSYVDSRLHEEEQSDILNRPGRVPGWSKYW